MPTHALRFWFEPPRTLDTLKSDQNDLVRVAKNIYAPLVSTFLDGKPQGMLAVDWTVDESGRNWRFRIKQGLKFDDGTPITPAAVYKNLQRILWLTKDDGLVMNALLPGAKGLKKYGDPIPGLKIDGDSILFNFARRPTNLFETLEQPMYAVANPKCFDSEGNWKEPLCSGASGAYRVKSITSRKIVLESRRVFPAVPGAPEVVEMGSFAENNGVLESISGEYADIALTGQQLAISRETRAEIARRGLQLIEAPPTQMHFVQLNAERPPFADKTLRQSVRDTFLRLLMENPTFSAAVKVNPSFIPRGGVGYKAFPISKEARARKIDRSSVEILSYSGSSYLSPTDRNVRIALETTLEEALREHGLKPHMIHLDDASKFFKRLDAGEFDALLRYSGVLVDDPLADLRMMFMSKAGAMIPDPSGKVAGLIEKAEATDDAGGRRAIVEAINSSVFDEASIVTYAHAGFSYLASPAVDLTRANLFSDPIEFRAVGWRSR